jgi:hypothetical protein
MNSTVSIGRKLLLFSLLILLVPLLVFPRQLGTELARVSLLNIMWELVYYGFIIFLFNRRLSLHRLVQVSGICLAYRFTIGAAFGLLMAALYSMQLSVSLQLGVLSYLPGVLFHIVVTPFVLMPALSPLLRTRIARRPAKGTMPKKPDIEPGATSIAISKERGVVSDAPPSAMRRDTAETVGETPQTHPTTSPSELNGFERATRYIGEHAAVHLAAVVDHEGLLLASFRRGDSVPEDWAPIALMLLESNGRVVSKAPGYGLPERVDLVWKSNRIVVARENWCCLLVIANRQSDDFLSIRINQGMDIVRKYVEERYTRAENSKMENVYVSGAQ